MSALRMFLILLGLFALGVGAITVVLALISPYLKLGLESYIWWGVGSFFGGLIWAVLFWPNPKSNNHN